MPRATETFKYYAIPTMKSMYNQMNNILDLMNRENILQRHLIETRQEIRAACHDVAIHSPGVKTSPDTTIRPTHLDQVVCTIFDVRAVGDNHD